MGMLFWVPGEACDYVRDLWPKLVAENNSSRGGHQAGPGEISGFMCGAERAVPLYFGRLWVCGEATRRDTGRGWVWWGTADRALEQLFEASAHPGRKIADIWLPELRLWHSSSAYPVARHRLPGGTCWRSLVNTARARLTEPPLA